MMLSNIYIPSFPDCILLDKDGIISGRSKFPTSIEMGENASKIKHRLT